MSFEEIRNDFLGVHVDAGVEFVKEGEFRREHRPEERFEFFLLTSGKAVEESAMEECGVDEKFLCVRDDSLSSFERIALWKSVSEE